MASPALACRDWDASVVEDIKFADVVVVGRIANYHIVLDEKSRRKRQEMLAAHPEMRSSFGDQKHWLTDYARLDLLVDRALVGRPPKVIPVTWDNSTFGEPEQMAPGPYLVALRNPRSPIPPLRGPSAAIMPNPEPAVMTVLQAPCSSAFIFEIGGSEAKRARKILGARLRKR